MDFSQVNWQAVLPRFGIGAQFLRKRHGPCPLCEGRDRFRFDNKGNMGTWYCQHCGAGNALTLLRRWTGENDRAILARIERFGGLAPCNDAPIKCIAPSEELTKEEVERNRKWLVQAWRGSVGLTVDPVTRYLKERVPGVDLRRIGRDIRYHPGMKYLEVDEHDKTINRGVFPVMLARVIDSKDTPITLHRTYLTSEGSKAPFGMVKKQMGGVRKLKGAAIRVTDVPGCRVLGACEGIETGLAVATAYRYRMPVWSFLNCGNLAVADIPKDRFDKVIIFEDHDPIDSTKGYRPGSHYAGLLRQKLEAEGFVVERRIPPREKMDFADLWKEHYLSLNQAP